MTALSVSALMLTYNHSRYVADAIESALGQSLPPSEVVVVDDGSIDDTVSRVRSIGDSRVRVIALAHQGIATLSENYRLGAEACAGDLIAFIEGDDRWPERKLERQVVDFADCDVVLSHGPYAVIGARGTPLKERVDLLTLSDGPYDALPHLLTASYIMSITAVVRRSAVLHVGFRQFVGTPHWDYPTFVALSEYGRFSYVDEVVGIWRKHGSSGTMMLAGRDLDGADCARELALATRERLADRPGLPSQARIDRAWTEGFGHQIWQAGRVLLVAKRYREAGALAQRGLRRGGSAATRARLLALLAAATCHVDLERIGRWSGQRSTIEELS